MAPSSFLPVLGPIVAAIIAGAVAFLASVFSKELKTSEFRQAWIDALRNDLSELISMALQLGDEIVVRHKAGEDPKAIQAHLRTEEPMFQRLEACRARILLRLNPREHQVLMNAVKIMSEPAEHDAKAETLITESQRVLKAEWRRVKRGEPVFRVTKWLSLIVSAAGLVVAIAVMYGRIRVIYVP
jgi:ABC-type hemin transport system substrate-binding protein